MNYKKRELCSGCGSQTHLVLVLEFGSIPLAGYFPEITEIAETNSYDCNLLFCDNCGMLQVDTLVDSSILFKDYRYMSSIGLTNHFSDVAAYLNERFSLQPEGLSVLEIGSNDGVLLKPLSDLGVQAVGFEPSSNISKVAKDKGCDVIVDFFNQETVAKHRPAKSVRVVVANNVFAHIDDLSSVVEGIKYCLDDEGTFVAEVHYLLNLVQQNQYDFIYHEHIFYHSLYSLNNFFRRHGMTLYDFDLIKTHSGSVRVFAKKGLESIPQKVAIQIEKEVVAGITTASGFHDFADGVKRHLTACNETITNLLLGGRTIVGFGASGRCNIFCNLLGLGTERVKFIFDQSPERINRFIPKANIPIIDFTDSANEQDYDVVLIFAWNFANMIMEKIDAKDYLVLFPQPLLLQKGAVVEGML